MFISFSEKGTKPRLYPSKKTPLHSVAEPKLIVSVPAPVLIKFMIREPATASTIAIKKLNYLCIAEIIYILFNFQLSNEYFIHTIYIQNTN